MNSIKLNELPSAYTDVIKALETDAELRKRFQYYFKILCTRLLGDIISDVSVYLQQGYKCRDTVISYSVQGMLYAELTTHKCNSVTLSTATGQAAIQLNSIGARYFKSITLLTLDLLSDDLFQERFKDFMLSRVYDENQPDVPHYLIMPYDSHKFNALNECLTNTGYYLDYLELKERLLTVLAYFTHHTLYKNKLYAEKYPDRSYANVTSSKFFKLLNPDLPPVEKYSQPKRIYGFPHFGRQEVCKEYRVITNMTLGLEYRVQQSLREGDKVRVTGKSTKPQEYTFLEVDSNNSVALLNKTGDVEYLVTLELVETSYSELFEENKTGIDWAKREVKLFPV